MVKHIVMWNFKKEIKEEEKPKLKREMSKNLIALVGKVPGLLEADFIEMPLSSSTHDMAMITLFESEDALNKYSSHPEHTNVANTYVRPYVFERCCMDYEIK